MGNEVKTGIDGVEINALATGDSNGNVEKLVVQYLTDEQAKDHGLENGAGFYSAPLLADGSAPDFKQAISVTEEELRAAGVEFVLPPEYVEFTAEAAKKLGLEHGAGWYYVLNNDDGTINFARPATQKEIAKIKGEIGDPDAQDFADTLSASGHPSVVKCVKTGKMCVPVYLLHMKDGSKSYRCRECMPPASEYVGFDMLEA